MNQHIIHGNFGDELKLTKGVPWGAILVLPDGRKFIAAQDSKLFDYNVKKKK